jgi:TolB-like protein
MLDQIRNKLVYWYENPGEPSVKNIARPVRVYAWQSEAADELPAGARLSMVLLPFGNLSIDPEQQYFADGSTKDLTTDLSRIAGSFVISRNTAFN